MKYNFEKLPKTFKKKWLAALRSGKFKQGKSSLKETDIFDTNRFVHCCLGVAGEICGCKRMEDKGLLLSGNGIWGISKVPSQLSKNEGLQTILAKQNDRGKNFKQIADWIEKYL